MQFTKNIKKNLGSEILRALNSPTLTLQTIGNGGTANERPITVKTNDI